MLREHVGLEVHLPARHEGGERRRLERVRHEDDGERVLRELRDGERDAVHGDGALLDAEPEDLHRRLDEDAEALALGLDRLDAPDGVHVALDEVAAERLAVAAPGLGRYLVEKGSITVDGVSLTVAALTEDGFEVALIPHTLEATTLGELAPGDEVNLEADVLAKYVEKLLGTMRP